MVQNSLYPCDAKLGRGAATSLHIFDSDAALASLAEHQRGTDRAIVKHLTHLQLPCEVLTVIKEQMVCKTGESYPANNTSS